MKGQKVRRITPVPTHLLLDAELPIEARGLLGVLCAEQKIELDLDKLRETCGVGRDKMAAMLSVLSAYGIVRLHHVRSESGRMDGQVWRFIGGQI